MHYEQLLIFVTFAAFAFANTVAGACIAVSWGGLEPELRRLSSGTRARALLLLRTAPVLAGGIAAVLAAAAFLRHEPRSTAEVPGWLLSALGAAGAALFLGGVCRIVGRCWRTYRFLQTIEGTATCVQVPGVGLPTWQVDIAFPLVALAGIWRSRLLVARSVLEEMPDDELRVVVRHELAHAKHRDNVASLLVTGMPDVLGLAERRLGIERAWHEAVEEAADDFATGGDEEARVSLASALIRVARMAGPQPAPRFPLLAFHGGESIERRVRRLVDAIEPRTRISPTTRRLAAIVSVVAVCALVLEWDAVLQVAHRATEWLVNA